MNHEPATEPPTWIVDYPDDPRWTISYNGGVVTGTLPNPSNISVRLLDQEDVHLDEVVAADPTVPSLVRAAKAASEHVRLFMRPSGSLGDDDEQLAVVLALQLLTRPAGDWPYFDHCGPGHQFYIAITIDQIGLDVEMMKRLFDPPFVPARSAARLAPLMTQDRNAERLVRVWADKIRYPGAWGDDGPPDEEVLGDLALFGERERTLFIQYLSEQFRNPSWQDAQGAADVLRAWERVTETPANPLHLRKRSGLYALAAKPAV